LTMIFIHQSRAVSKTLRFFFVIIFILDLSKVSKSRSLKSGLKSEKSKIFLVEIQDGQCLGTDPYFAIY